MNMHGAPALGGAEEGIAEAPACESLWPDSQNSAAGEAARVCFQTALV